MTDIGRSIPIERDAQQLQDVDLLLSQVRQLARRLVPAKDMAIAVSDAFRGNAAAALGRPFIKPLQLAANTHLGLASSRGHARLAQRYANGGDDVIFVAEMFDPDGRGMGVLAVELDRDVNDVRGAAETVQSLADTVSMLLQTRRAYLAQQIELETMQRRVARLEKLSRSDPLTGLENSGGFEFSARARLGDPSRTQMLVIVDIDHFKAINDLYGHQFGDTFLCTVAQALREDLPEGSVIGRLGGDEFGALIDIPDREAAFLEGLMARCRISIMRETALLGKPNMGRVSVGAALFPKNATTYEELFDLADSALYTSKKNGRGAQTVFSPEQHLRFNPREIGRKFRIAAEQGRIVPYFQPIYTLDTGECCGFEMLARWDDADYGLMTPDKFRAIFSDHANAEYLTRLLTRSALKSLRSIGRRGEVPPLLTINVTAFDLMNPEFVFDFQSMLSDSGDFHWSSIVIEVTEEIMLGARNGQVFQTLAEMRLRGARVALDDFGTGYGGLQHISGWPIDIIKIDRGFVDRMEQSVRDEAIVEAIVNLARRADLRVVAEGVETGFQLHKLIDMGCDAAQGYLFSPPVPAERLSVSSAPFDLARDIA